MLEIDVFKLNGELRSFSWWDFDRM
jgi:hypothetical protein